MILKINDALQKQLDEVAEIAGYLWERGWAERNAGNISINISDIIGEENKSLRTLGTYPLVRNMGKLSGNFFYITGTGKRMRHVAKDPLKNGSIVRVSSDGNSYDIIGEENIQPTCEITTHLSVQTSFLQKKNGYKLILHTHPTDIISLSHITELKDRSVFNRIMWEMHPETFIVVPKGIGFAPYAVPGSQEMADFTMSELENHDVVLWEKHGVFATGKNLTDVFDVIDTLSKSAQIYSFVKNCGSTPERLSRQQIEVLIEPFDLKENNLETYY